MDYKEQDNAVKTKFHEMLVSLLEFAICQQNRVHKPYRDHESMKKKAVQASWTPPLQIEHEIINGAIAKVKISLIDQNRLAKAPKG